MVVVVVVDVVVFLSVGNVVLGHLKVVINSVFSVVGGLSGNLFAVPKSSTKVANMFHHSKVSRICRTM